MAKIWIDAGHGGWDPGAVNKFLGLEEAQLALDVAQELSILCKEIGHIVRNTRQTRQDTPVNRNKSADLRKRVVLANQFGADCFISIHFNSSGKGTASGFEIFISDEKSYPLASQIVTAVRSTFPGMKIRGVGGNDVKRANFTVLKQIRPAVLIECGFIDNTEDAKWFSSAKNRRAFASAICSGIRNSGV